MQIKYEYKTVIILWKGKVIFMTQFWYIIQINTNQKKKIVKFYKEVGL